MPGESLQKDLAEVLNYWSAENGSDTPDWILAKYLIACLRAFNETSRARETWYGKALRIGGVKDIAQPDPPQFDPPPQTTEAP